ncbi:hypothetical protein [Sphaerisporangium fuscum]|uniref:hypothetical protein n=1 Tax=Sphaerisporangium fuscum TaxID=2835868 RepID=UPI001BDBBA73|nr:hypothetical protein [Sphaerisporangium fuscum]
MNGWGSRIRGSLAVSVLGAGLVMLGSTPSSADTDYHHYEYICSGGAFLPKQSSQPVQVQVAIPRTVRVGERLALEWTLTGSPLLASFPFSAGGRLTATAKVDVAGLWQGTLDSAGSKDQGELKQGSRLELPTAVTGSVSTAKEGKLSITPRDLVLEFTPPASTVRVNDTDDPNEQVASESHRHGPIVYQGDWRYYGKTDRAKYGDHLDDLHATNAASGSVEVKFLGDGIQYIGERVSSVGKVKVYIDGADEPVDEVNAYDPAPVDKPNAQAVLWVKKDLPYGWHTVRFTKGEPASAYMAVDAFDFITSTLPAPPPMFKATCSYKGVPTTVNVDVLPASTNGNGNNGGAGGSNGDGRVSDGDDSVRGVVVLSGGGQGHGTPTATATATTTVTPKPTSTAKASKTPKVSRTPQVRVTPVGGAHTGERPDPDSTGPLLMGYGAALALGGFAGHLVLRRRRAAHDLVHAPGETETPR